ncbi:hypothetical protein ACFW96_06915 [Streptomyces gardneri]|uniref:hypothetical protein n=1 Tax=Streptomyces gardneri TaxID=66892 RepID=UPI0036A71C52
MVALGGAGVPPPGAPRLPLRTAGGDAVRDRRKRGSRGGPAPKYGKDDHEQRHAVEGGN